MKNILLFHKINNRTIIQSTPSLKLVSIFFILTVFIGYSNKAFSFNLPTSPPMVRIKLAGMPNYLDETVIYYQAGATDGFDSQFDAYKLPGGMPAPYIAQQYGNTVLAINGISPIVQTFSIHLKVTTPITGSYTLFTTDFGDLPTGTCVNLTDLYTNTTVDILANSYVCNLVDTTITSRFIVTINHFRLPVISNINQPSCLAASSGKFKIDGNNFGPWNYVWTDTTGTIIKNTNAIMTSDSITNISNGYYHVGVTSVSNQCYSFDTTVYFNGIINPTVAFTAPDTIVASFAQNFFPSNLSTNCVSHSWYFGNGASSSTIQPSYCYNVPGLYTVKLKGISSTGCVDSSFKSLTVLGIVTATKNELKNTIKFYNTSDNIYVIEVNKNLITELTINLYDSQGNEWLQEHRENIMPNDKINLNLNKFTAGIYVINLSTKNSLINTTKIIIK